MYMSTYYIQNNVPKNVHVIMKKCVLQTTIIMLAHPNIISNIHSRLKIMTLLLTTSPSPPIIIIIMIIIIVIM